MRGVGVTRKHDSDAYQAATAAAREVRALVAEQLHALVSGLDRMGSQDEVVHRIRDASARAQQVLEARGRHEQSRQMGLPLAPSLEAEAEALSLLREAVMQLGAAAGGWVAAMDFEVLRSRDAGLNGALQP